MSMDEDEVRTLTVDEIALLRKISRWRRNHGVNFFQWRPGVGFGAFTEWYRQDDGKRTTVSFEPKGARFLVTRDYYGGAELRELPVQSATEAVDCLVALGFLPARFNSAYRAGWDACAMWTEGDSQSPAFRRMFHDPENVSFPAGDPTW